MKCREILTVENNEEQLSQRCVEVDTLKESKECREITSEIKKVMRNHDDIVALSAPAIGFGKRIFCIDFKDQEIKTFVNPVIAGAKGLTLARETSCLLPGRTFIRPRNTEIEVMYQNPMGKAKSRKLLGMVAIVFQQMMDDLDGMFLSDVGLEIDEDFDKASEEEQMEIISMYADSLDLKLADINKDIESDDVAKTYKNTIDFLTSVYKGETQLVNPTEEEESENG